MPWLRYWLTQNPWTLLLPFWCFIAPDKVPQRLAQTLIFAFARYVNYNTYYAMWKTWASVEYNIVALQWVSLPME